MSFVDEHEEDQIDDPVAEIIQVEQKKPEKPKDGDNPDGDDAPQDGGDAPADDADPDAKPKWDPSKYQWTVSNGNPKSLTKILHKKFQSNDVKILFNLFIT